MAYPAAPAGYTLIDVEVTVGEAAVQGCRIHPAEYLDETDFRELIEWLREAIPAGLVVRFPASLEEFGMAELLEDRALADSVAGSAAIRLPDSGLVMSRRDTVEYLASYIPDGMRTSPVMVSWPRQTDFTRFSHLWKRRPAKEDHFDYMESLDDFHTAVERPLKLISLGKAMGELHDVGVIRVDGHEGNWTYDIAQTPPLTSFDLADTRFVYPPVDPVACANDLVPLMNSFSRRDWASFRQGYLMQRPEAGQLVMAVVQRADLTGWSIAYDTGDYLTSLHRLDRALGLSPVASERVRLLGFRALVMSRLGRHEDALAQYRAVLPESHGSEWEVAHRFHYGQALLRAGLSAESRAEFQWVLDHAGDSPSDERLCAAARQALEQLPVAHDTDLPGTGPDGLQ